MKAYLTTSRKKVVLITDEGADVLHMRKFQFLNGEPMTAEFMEQVIRDMNNPIAADARRRQLARDIKASQLRFERLLTA